MFSERLNGKWHVRRLYSVSSWVCFNYPCCDLPTLATFFPFLYLFPYLLIHSFHPMVFPLCLLFPLSLFWRCDQLKCLCQLRRVLPHLQLSHWTAPDLTSSNFFSTSNVSSTLGRSAADLTFSYFFSPLVMFLYLFCFTYNSWGTTIIYIHTL